MALTITTLANPIGNKLLHESALGATVLTSVTGASGLIYMIEGDNSGVGSATYLKIFDAGSVTLGSSSPDFVFKFTANTRSVLVFPTGLAFTNLSLAAVTGAAVTSTTAPSANFGVRLVTS